jgi:hypothetical protein
MDRYQDSQSWESDDEISDGQLVEYWPLEDDEDDDDGGEPFSSESDESEQPFSFGLWIQVLWQHPLIFWSGIWAIVFLVAGLAFTGLVSPYLSSQTAETTAPMPGQPSATTKSEGDTLPIWTVGAIAVACAAGSLLISQRMKYQNSHQSLKSKQPKDAGHALMAATSPSPLPPTTPIQPFQPVVPSPQLATIPALPSVAEEPVVTVVPADEATPLDWQEASLADIMDIRYRRHPQR